MSRAVPRKRRPEPRASFGANRDSIMGRPDRPWTDRAAGDEAFNRLASDRRLRATRDRAGRIMLREQDIRFRTGRSVKYLIAAT